MKTNNINWKKLTEYVCEAITAIMAIVALVMGASVMNSCSIKRVITNTANYTTKGDTTTIIQTKTTEVYNLKKENESWK